ncbi:MAG: hypothetical protein HY594_04520 [Candidatus Omnitrophica bacterium]|nr:hypothetical protein [Candidatus Omnitrophota bacterium]
MKLRFGLVFLFCIAGSGCAAAAVLGAGAVAGYAVSRDHVEMMVERPYPQVWAAVLDETKRFALLKETYPAQGLIEANAQGTHLVITVAKETELTVKVVIKARRNLLPKIDVAQRLATRIAKRIG